MDVLRLGDKLVQEKVITEEQLDKALKKQKELRANGVQDEKSLIGLVLVKEGYMSESVLIKHIFNKDLNADKKSLAEEVAENVKDS